MKEFGSKWDLLVFAGEGGGVYKVREVFSKY